MEHEINARPPLVSVVCDTYNQAGYIGKAIESFLMQKTDFPVEIILHDDASTDGTADIVRAYAERYPDKIRAVLRRENLFSTDQKILEHAMFPLCLGKYVAICEGDDYWTDPHKLQKQADYMESHPECTLCFTGAELVDGNGKHLGRQQPYGESRIVPTEDVIMGMGGFCPTASIMAPTRLAQNRAPFCDLTEIDDAPLQIFFASRGTTYYMAEPTCAYRVNAAGSWTVAQNSLAVEKKVARQRSLIAMHQAFDLDTEGRYHEAVEYALAVDRFEILWLTGDLPGMKAPAFRPFYDKLPLRSKLRLHLSAHFPGLYRILKGGKHGA